MHTVFHPLLISTIFCLVRLAAGVCPHGYSKDYANEKCYMFMDTAQASYNEASAQCATRANGHLPVVLSQEDNEALVRLWLEERNDDAGGYPWLGLQCKKPQDCKWTNAEPYDFNLFEDSLADTSLGNCVSIRGPFNNNRTVWRSTTCEEPKLVICETDQISLCDSPYRNLDGNCLLYLPELRLNYFGAESYCRSKHGFLIVIDSAAENNAVVRFLHEENAKFAKRGVSAPTEVFLGAKLNSDGSFEWADGTHFTYLKFDEPFPSERYGHCLKMMLSSSDDSNSNNTEAVRSGSWQNTVCDSYLSFICKYRDATPTPPNECPTQRYYPDSGRIQSPNFPFYYGEGLNCVYHVNVDLKNFIHVKVDSLNLADEDVLEFYDGEDSKDPFLSLSGDSLTEFTTTKSNLLRIRFRSFQAENHSSENGSTTSMQKIGWHLSFKPVGHRNASDEEEINREAPRDAACPASTYVIPDGEVSTLGFNDGLNYANFVNCSYLITAPKSQVVQLEFEEFRTEECCDFLYIHDGRDVDAPLIERMSGWNMSGKKLRSSGSALRLLFISDSQQNDHGFAAKYAFIDASNNASATTNTTSA